MQCNLFDFSVCLVIVCCFLEMELWCEWVIKMLLFCIWLEVALEVDLKWVVLMVIDGECCKCAV